MLGPVGYTKSVSYCGFTKLEVKQLGPQLSLGCSVAAPAKLVSFLFGFSFSHTSLPLKNGGSFLVDNIETVPYSTGTVCRYNNNNNNNMFICQQHCKRYDYGT